MSTKKGPKSKGTGSKGKAVAKGQKTAKATRAPKARLETPATEVVDATPIPEAEPLQEAKPQKAPRIRDPRLPEVGTPIARAWRGHEVVVTERDDGSFALVFDGEDLGSHKSLTRAAEVALAREGIASGVNGFVWFKVGTAAQTPRPRKGTSIEALTKEVERLQARFDKAAQRAAEAEADLETAKKALVEAKAAEAHDA